MAAADSRNSALPQAEAKMSVRSVARGRKVGPNINNRGSSLSRIGEVSVLAGSGLVGFNMLWLTFGNNKYVA